MAFYWGIRKKLVSIMILTMLPLLAGSVWITASLVEKSYSNQAAILESNTLDNVTSRLNYLTRMALSDTSFLATLPSLASLAQTVQHRKEGIQLGHEIGQEYSASLKALTGFMNSKKIYDQARLLCSDGREILRVNFKNQVAREVPVTHLQAKGTRYYFTAAAKLPAGRVYVSYVDLNREMGQIERPYKPVLRFAAPLRDAKGELTGVMVLNFFAEEMFEKALQGVKDRLPGDWMILDQNGYYLYHSRQPERLWGSPRDLDSGHSCQKDFGAACQSMLGGKYVSLRVEGGRWAAYSRIVTFPQNPDKFLAVVHLTPPPPFVEYVYQFGWALVGIMVLAVAAAVLLGWLSGQMVIQPLTELTDTMRHFSQEDWSARSNLTSHDELGELASGFNDMAVRLHTLYTDLESKVRDRTERLNQINHLLQHSEARTRAILDNTVDAIITIDSVGVVQSFNQGAERLFGYTAGEVVGNKINMLQPPDVAGKHDEYLASYLETGEAHIIGKGREERGRRKDGSIFPMYLAVSEVRVDDTVLFTGIIRDITELRAAEDSLRQSQRMYKTLTEAAPVGIFYTDPQGQCTYINEQWSEIAGISEKDARGDGWIKAIHPDDKPFIWEQWNYTAKSGKQFEAEYRFIRPDGKLVWVYGRAVAQKDHQNKIIGYVGTVTDITKNKNTEKALIESERYTKTLFESSPIGLALCKMDGTLVEVNQAYADIIGRSIPEALGLTYWEITPDKYQPQEKALLDELEQHARYGPYEKEYQHRDGHLVPVLLNGVIVTRGDERFIWSAVEDISQRKQTEKDNLVLGRILDDSINEIYIFSLEDLKFLQVNRGARENLGYTMDELKGMTPLDIKPEFTLEEFEELIAPLRDGSRQRLDFNTMHLRKDGSRYPVEINLQLSSHALDQVFVAIIKDTTESIKARNEIDRLSLVAERTDNVVIITDGRGVIQWVNNAFTRISGYSPEEAIGKNPGELLHGEETDPDTVIQMGQKLARGEGANVELVNYSKDGRKYWLSIDMQPVSDNHGKITNFVAVEHDITERKRTELELRRQAQIIDQIHDAVVSMDLNGTVSTWNQGAQALFGYTKDEAIGSNISMIHVEENRLRLNELIFEPLQQSGKLEVEMDVRNKSGEKFPSFLSLSVLNNLNNKPTGFVGYAVDISERKRAMEAIRNAKEAAEAASKTKSEFLANMSHELRTPLNAIIGFSEILLDQVFGELNQKQTRQTRHILESGRHLLSVINDILDLSKVESGKMKLEPSVVNPADLLESSLVLIKEKTSRHGIGLSLQLPESLRGLNMSADERKLKQIMFNLLSNAAKFTPDGGRITIAASQMADQLRVEVSDTGVGIEPANQERIFGEFEQVDSTYARQQQGTGLGLSLTRKLVELHGGRIWVESAGKDTGSAFIFTIPIRPAGVQNDPPSEKEMEKDSGVDKDVRGDSRAILVVDDDLMARELISGYLQEGGYEVHTAATGAQGLEMARTIHPLAITLDILLPDITGFEVLRQLKEDESTANIPVVVLTITDDREKGLSLGAADFLQKPVRKEELYGALPELAACGTGGFRKVLVVDDNPADVELVNEILDKRGCEVISAMDGTKGIDLALREKPDLIILDMNMPGISGWDVLETLRTVGGDVHPPILVFTAADLSSTERQRLSSRVQAVVLKGGGKQDLLREIDRLTRMAFEGS